MRERESLVERLIKQRQFLPFDHQTFRYWTRTIQSMLFENRKIIKYHDVILFLFCHKFPNLYSNKVTRILKENPNKNNYLVSNFYKKLKSPALFFHGEIGEMCGNFQFVVEIVHKAIVFYFDFPLAQVQQKFRSAIFLPTQSLAQLLPQPDGLHE